MINETATKLTYEMITSVTHQPIIIWGLVAINLFVLTLFFLYGWFAKARTSKGVVVKGIRPIYKGGFWAGFFILWFIYNGIIILFLIFPIWSKMGI